MADYEATPDTRSLFAAALAEGATAATGRQLFGTQQGCDGEIHALLRAPSGILYFGGSFAHCDAVSANNIVAYDPQTRRFSALGEGTDGEVRSLATDGSRLYVGGKFTHAGGQSANRVARWSGGQWSALGEGSNGIGDVTVDALLFRDGRLYVGGQFAQAGQTLTANIASWDGSIWSALSDGLGVNSFDQVKALAWFNGELYAAGQFELTGSGSTRVNHIARWSGSEWGALGDAENVGVNQPLITALAVDDGQLLVAGTFHLAGSIAGTGRVARWDGRAWSAVESAAALPSSLSPEALVSADHEIYVSGYDFDASAWTIWCWDGTTFSALPKIGSSHYAMALADGELYADSTHRWNGRAWLAIGDGVQTGVLGTVNALAASDEYLYVAGSIEQVDSLAVSSIARWNGNRWSALSDELGEGVNGPVYALAVDGAKLYVGGRFTRAGGVAANNIAVWENGGWSALGAGVSGGDIFPTVYAITVISGEIFVGGYFARAGDVDANGLAQWAGDQWHAVGSGLGDSRPVQLRVDGLATDGQNLYVGGYFNRAGNLSGVNGIARWDGQQWHALGTGFSGVTSSGGHVGLLGAHLLVSAGELYVAGGFSAAGNVTAPGLARWDGTAWSNPLAGTSLGVFGSRGLAELNGVIYLAADNITVNNIGLGPALLRVDGGDVRVIREGLSTALLADGDALLTGSSAGLAQVPAATARSRAPGGPAGDGASDQPVINRQGRYMAFRSAASDLVGGDDNGREDVFLTELASGRITRLSAALGDIDQAYAEPSISADGASVAISGTSGQIYLVSNGAGRVVSTNERGDPGNAPSYSPMLSGSGRFLAFVSLSSNLDGSDVASPTVPSIFSKDLENGSVQLISSGIAGNAANGASRLPAMSDDGQLVVFSTLATNLVLPIEPSNVEQAIMVLDNSGVQARRYLSRNLQTGELGNGPSSNVRITPDGRYGVFESSASNLVEGDHNGVSDIYYFELAGAELVSLQRVSVSSAGIEGNGPSRNASISDDGRYVSFQTDASNLVPFDRNEQTDVMLRWMGDGGVARLSAHVDGQTSDRTSLQPALSGDGSLIVFASDARLDEGDLNDHRDVYTIELRDRSQSIPAGPVDEPRLSQLPLPLPNPDYDNCPAGFFIAEVVDGPGEGLQSGIFALELLLDEPGTRELAGGLNFGGLIDRGQVGFAGINIANENAEAQILNIDLRGNPAGDEFGNMPVMVTVNRRTETSSETIYQIAANISLQQPLLHSLEVEPGFYELTVAPMSGDVGGEAEGAYYFSLATHFVDRPGGGFQGGAVVGGYHAEHPFAGVSGFAAFCLATPHSTSILVRSRPTYGESGARDLQLRLRDAYRQQFIVNPVGNRPASR